MGTRPGRSTPPPGRASLTRWSRNVVGFGRAPVFRRHRDALTRAILPDDLRPDRTTSAAAAPSRRRPRCVGTGLHDVPITSSDRRDIGHDELSDFIRRFASRRAIRIVAARSVLAAIASEPDFEPMFSGDPSKLMRPMRRSQPRKCLGPDQAETPNRSGVRLDPTDAARGEIGSRTIDRDRGGVPCRLPRSKDAMGLLDFRHDRRDRQGREGPRVRGKVSLPGVEGLESRALLASGSVAVNPPPDPQVVLSPQDVQTLLARAARATASDNAIVAVVDRNGDPPGHPRRGERLAGDHRQHREARLRGRRRPGRGADRRLLRQQPRPA